MVFLTLYLVSRQPFVVSFTRVNVVCFFSCTWFQNFSLRVVPHQEHLGLIPPQNCDSRHPEVTNAMRPAPVPADDDNIGSEEDRLVADPLADYTDQLWKETAKQNREIFTELFRPVPTNLVQNVEAYDVWFILFFSFI